MALTKSKSSINDDKIGMHKSPAKRKIKLKTKQNDRSVRAFIDSIEDKSLRKDCNILLKLFKETTGFLPKMWGDSIIGFGKYTYYRANGAEGVFMATGFSPRKSGPTLYIMPGYQDYQDILKQLGPHKLGKCCLYLKNLEHVNMLVLKKLIKQGLQDLSKRHSMNSKSKKSNKTSLL